MNPGIDPAEEQSQIEAEAKRLASERGGAECSYSDEDWNKAIRIVRNRRISLSKA